MTYDYAVKYEGKVYKAGEDVPIPDISEILPFGYELTNDVPEGALDVHEDGSVNTYDTDGNIVGTVDAETFEKMVNIDDKPATKKKSSK